MNRLIAFAGLLAFVVIVVVEHALEPQLAPATHEISEYANTESGALMTFGFLAWSASLLATAALSHRDDRVRMRSPGGIVLGVLLAIASGGLLLTACFATQTNAGALPSGTRLEAGGRIHDLASAAALAAIFVAVIVSLVAVRGRPRFRALAAAALAVSVIANAVLLTIGHPVDGVRQRVLIAVGCAWQLALIRALTGGSTGL